MDGQAIVEALKAWVPAEGLEAEEPRDGMPTIVVARGQVQETARKLRDELGFSVLVDVVPVDYHPQEPRFHISYLLLAPPGGPGEGGKRLRMKVRVPGTEPTVPTLSAVWRSANWGEREAFDFYGIAFEGHPDLRRILMPDDWEGHPMRKDYPVQIKEPVKTAWPLQMSSEEFAANIEAARQHTPDRT